LIAEKHFRSGEQVCNAAYLCLANTANIALISILTGFLMSSIVFSLSRLGCLFIRVRTLAALLFAAGLCLSTLVSATETTHPESKIYDAARDAPADVSAALARAKASSKRTILVMGANWCHDSRALAGWFESTRFKAMLTPLYEIVYVDVGKPQSNKGRNLEIARGFGVKKIKGTPTVLVLSPDGILLNKKDAPTWRNAASRSENAIFAYFAEFDR
jgi:Thioredoxin-like